MNVDGRDKVWQTHMLRALDSAIGAGPTAKQALNAIVAGVMNQRTRADASRLPCPRLLVGEESFT